MPGAAPLVDEPLRDRIDALLRELCAMPSPSGEEAAVRDRVAALCRAAGFADQDVDAAGNLWARPPGPRAEEPTVLCAHLDTVGHDGIPIEPVLEDDGWVNRNDAILGADNKAAIAVMLACVERLDAADPAALAGVELLFTVQEEQALAGAAAADAGRLAGATVYVYDHATPIGGVIVASPTYYRVDATFRGQAAHAGICPERGRSAIRAAARAVAAIPHGRLDPETTVNAGQLHGGVGTGTNIVADRCTAAIEIRSLSDARAEQVLAEVLDALQDAAAEEPGPCDVDLHVERAFAGYRHRPDTGAVLRAAAALERCGHRVEHVASGGGSDANAFLAHGVTAVCLANGTEDPHEPTERVSRTALADMARVTFALLSGQ